LRQSGRARELLIDGLFYPGKANQPWTVAVAVILLWTMIGVVTEVFLKAAEVLWEEFHGEP
jgi:hypothetical protein